MFNKILKKIKFFINLDLRRKLQKLNLYPHFVKKNFFLKLYGRFIFNIIFLNRFNKLRKKLLNKVYDNKKYKKKNFLVSLPRSGSMFVRCSLSSYNELYYKIGDGVPKYDSINDKWIFAYRPILESNVWGLLDPEKFNQSLFLSNDKKENNEVVFSRYPSTEVDLFDINFAKPVVLFRNPYDQILSLYNKHQYKFSNSPIDINYKLLKDSIEIYENFINFWKNYSLNKIPKEDYLFIKYDDLIDKSDEKFLEILTFFNYPIDLNYIKKSVDINSKDNTFERLKNIKINKIRFTDQSKLKETSLKIKDIFYKELEGKKIENAYQKLND